MRFSILVIDDDIEVCNFMETFLQQDGYDVKCIHDPLQVIKELNNQNYHLVILDLMLPNVNGLSVLEDIRKHDKDVAVVIFTGYPSVDSAVQSMKYDISGYIKKPFKVNEFRDVIKNIVEKKRLCLDLETQLHITIGHNVRIFRKLKNLTLKQLARRTGLSVSLLSQVERAESSASVSTLLKISHALDIKITKLFEKNDI